MKSRLPDLLPKLYLPLLLVLCAAFSWQPLVGVDDFWAHAAIGRWMAEHGRVPDQTLFLWGPGTPVPWVYHSWLSQWVFFKCLDGVDLQTGALRALLLTIGVSLVSVVWMWQLWARRGRISALTPFIVAIVIWCSSPRIHPRPELFSGLFLLMLMTFLLVWTERRDGEAKGGAAQLPDHLTWRVAGVCLLFVVWANFHGGVATGLVFIALTIAGEGIQDLWEKRALRPTLLLCGILLLCALAININPYGVHYWVSLSDVRSKKFSYITEWQNVFSPPALPPEAVFTTALLVLLPFCAWLSSPRRRVAHLLWLAFAFVSYVMARRQIAQMAQISLLVMAANSAALDTKRFWRSLSVPRKNTETTVGEAPATAEPPAPARLLARVASVSCLLCMIPGAVSPETRGLSALSPRLPMAAADYVRKNLPDSRLLSDYSTSSYLNWHLAGHPALYIDLINAYPDQLMKDYFAMSYMDPGAEKLLYDSGATHVFINEGMKNGKIAKFYKYIGGSPLWKVVYHDKNATIWAWRDLKAKTSH